MLATRFDVIIASVTIPVCCTNDFEFTTHIKGGMVSIDKQAEDSPLFTPSGSFVDEDGQEHHYGGELRNEESIMDELREKKLRVSFHDLSQALAETETMGDDEMMSRVEFVPDPKLEAREEIYALCLAGNARVGADSPARALDKNLLRIVASFSVRGVRPPPHYQRLRGFHTSTDVFLPTWVDEEHEFMTECIVQPEHRYESTRITCHYRLTCLLVRLRPDGHEAYSGMRSAYADPAWFGVF